jgi:hypothetical protein
MKNVSGISVYSKQYTSPILSDETIVSGFIIKLISCMYDLPDWSPFLQRNCKCWTLPTINQEIYSSSEAEEQYCWFLQDEASAHTTVEMLQEFFIECIFLKIYGLSDLWIYCHLTFTFVYF